MINVFVEDLVFLKCQELKPKYKFKLPKNQDKQ